MSVSAGPVPSVNVELEVREFPCPGPDPLACQALVAPIPVEALTISKFTFYTGHAKLLLLTYSQRLPSPIRPSPTFLTML